MVAKSQGKGVMDCKCFNGDKVSVWEDEKVLEMEGGGVCTTMWMLMSRTVHLKVAKMLNFLLCISYHNKKYTVYLPFNLG